MKKALCSVVLAAAMIFGAATAPGFADDSTKEHTKVEKTDKVKHKKPSQVTTHAKTAPVVNGTIQNDYYTAEREKQLKPDM